MDFDSEFFAWALIGTEIVVVLIIVIAQDKQRKPFFGDSRNDS